MISKLYNQNQKNFEGGIMRKLAVAGMVILMLVSCKKESKETTVAGYVYSYNGQYPLGGIKAYINTQSSKYDYTDSEGFFQIENPPTGNQILVLESGSFKTEINIEIKENEENVVSSKDNPIKFGKETVSPVKMAVVYGSYDEIQALLDSIGFPRISSPDVDSTGYVFYNNYTDILYNLSELAKFDILFLNCSDYWDFRTDNTAITNLQNYTQNGGSLYASDWAYDAVEATFPDYIDFYGEDSIAGSAQQGMSENNVKSEILDQRI